jgi:hypothetical protein
MRPAFTILISTGAVAAMAALCIAAGTDQLTTQVFVSWTGAPYLGYCGLAVTRRTARAAASVFAASTCSAVLATTLYWSDLRPFIVASPGEEPMNCAGPLVELMVPLAQWLSVGILWAATRSGRSETLPA